MAFSSPILGCNVATKECTESCSSDDDCKDMMKCLATAGSGKICLPADCETCYEHDRTCTHSTPNLSSDDEDARKCEFIDCN